MRKKLSKKQAAIKNLTAVGEKIKNGTSRAVVLCELWAKDDKGVSYLKEYVKLDTGDLITLANVKTFRKHKPKHSLDYKRNWPYIRTPGEPLKTSNFYLGRKYKKGF